MKVIDIHAHTFPEKVARKAIETLSAKSHTRAFTDGTISLLAGSMNEAGIAYSVLQPVATKPSQVQHINDAAIKAQGRILSFGGMHPDFEDYEAELSRITEAGIKGVKIHPLYQDVNIDDQRYVKILACAGELGLVVMIHAGLDIGFGDDDKAIPQRILRALESAGNPRVILAHMGGWKCWLEAEELFARHDEVFIDTAFSLGKFVPNGDGYYSGGEDCMMLSTEEFVRMIKNFGADRVLFGTDSPWSSQAECVKSFEALPLSEQEKELILYRNSAKILGLNLTP